MVSHIMFEAEFYNPTTGFGRKAGARGVYEMPVWCFLLISKHLLMH